MALTVSACCDILPFCLKCGRYDSVIAGHAITLSGLKKELLLSPIYGTLMALIKRAGSGRLDTMDASNDVVKAVLDNGRLKPEHLISDGILALPGMRQVELDELQQFVTKMTASLEAARRPSKVIHPARLPTVRPPPSALPPLAPQRIVWEEIEMLTFLPRLAFRRTERAVRMTTTSVRSATRVLWTPPLSRASTDHVIAAYQGTF